MWQDEAACRRSGADPRWFDDHVDIGVAIRETDSRRDARHALAARVCESCPVRKPCGRYADRHRGEVAGVWAGQLYHANLTGPDPIVREWMQAAGVETVHNDVKITDPEGDGLGLLLTTD